jgi:hypothetical protein
MISIMVLLFIAPILLRSAMLRAPEARHYVAQPVPEARPRAEGLGLGKL